MIIIYIFSCFWMLIGQNKTFEDISLNSETFFSQFSNILKTWELIDDEKQSLILYQHVRNDLSVTEQRTVSAGVGWIPCRAVIRATSLTSSEQKITTAVTCTHTRGCFTHTHIYMTHGRPPTLLHRKPAQEVDWWSLNLQRLVNNTHSVPNKWD